MPGKVFVGQSVQRLEDPDLLRGRGQFLDDLALPGMLEAPFVRRPFAHASFGRIDTPAAAALPPPRAGRRWPPPWPPRPGPGPVAYKKNPAPHPRPKGGLGGGGL